MGRRRHAARVAGDHGLAGHKARHKGVRPRMETHPGERPRRRGGGGASGFGLQVGCHLAAAHLAGGGVDRSADDGLSAGAVIDHPADLE